MNRIKMMSIAVAVIWGAHVPDATAKTYKCKTNSGRIEYSGTPCSSGFRQEGDHWVDVEAERNQERLKERSRREAKARQERKNGTSRGGSSLGSSGLATNEPSYSSATRQDIDRLTTYSVILGRAIACGADASNASRRVGRWMDEVFPPGSADQQTYLPIFMAGISYHAEQQKSGKSPDSCSSALRTFSGFPWP